MLEAKDRGGTCWGSSVVSQLVSSESESVYQELGALVDEGTFRTSWAKAKLYVGVGDMDDLNLLIMTLALHAQSS